MSGYIDEALARCRLPISIEYDKEAKVFHWSDPMGGGYCKTPAQATRAYLSLVTALTDKGVG